MYRLHHLAAINIDASECNVEPQLVWFLSVSLSLEIKQQNSQSAPLSTVIFRSRPSRVPLRFLPRLPLETDSPSVILLVCTSLSILVPHP